MTRSPYAYAKKFRFTGLVELTYRDYSTESRYHGGSSKSDYSAFEQRYRLGLRGYIYHPKLVSFFTSVTFRRESGDGDSGQDYDADDLNYDFSVSILPLNPVSLDLYAMRSDSTIEGWGTGPFSITSNYYGALFRFTKMKFPFVIIEYNHLDYTTERDSGSLVYDPIKKKVVVKTRRLEYKSEIDRLHLNVNGTLKRINTKYSFVATFSDYSSPSRDYDAREVIATTYTVIKRENWLLTSFQYSDMEPYERTMFAVDLRLAPIGRLYHSYRYEYLTYESEREQRDAHTIGNNLVYKFKRLFNASSNVRYSFGKRDGVREESYDIRAALNYTRPVKNFDFISYYRFSLSKDERYGDNNYMSNSLGIGLSTWKFTLGKAYANYDLTIRKYDYSYTGRGYDYYDFEYDEPEKLSSEGDSTEHLIRAGVSGKGPRRMYWNMEAEVRIYDSNTQDHDTVFWVGEEQWAEKVRHYTITGDVGFPFGRRGLVTAKASYTTGQTNSDDVERYYYEFHLNYRILRNLNFLSWWREDYRNKGWWAGSSFAIQRPYGWKTREYEVDLQYVYRRITFTLEYNVYRVEEGSYVSENKRFLLRARRPF